MRQSVVYYPIGMIDRSTFDWHIVSIIALVL